MVLLIVNFCSGGIWNVYVTCKCSLYYFYTLCVTFLIGRTNHINRWTVTVAGTFATNGSSSISKTILSLCSFGSVWFWYPHWWQNYPQDRFIAKYTKSTQPEVRAMADHLVCWWRSWKFCTCYYANDFLTFLFLLLRSCQPWLDLTLSFNHI